MAIGEGGGIGVGGTPLPSIQISQQAASIRNSEDDQKKGAAEENVQTVAAAPPAPEDPRGKILNVSA